MRECLALAEKGTGYVSPNPMVGAVLVKNGTIVARGFHRLFGSPHAEVNCLDSFRGTTGGTTLYVNLEPCSHTGKTPPCTERIIASGIKTVVVAMQDPNPLVAGRGIRKLRSAGIRVITGVLENEAASLNKIFVRHITRHLPYVHVKIAQSMDGFIAGARRKGWITSLPSRTLVHRWRAMYDAVLVGATTVNIDDPRLNVRHVSGRDPAVAILDGSLSVKDSAKVFRGNGGRVFVLADQSSVRKKRRKVERLQSTGALIIPVIGRNGILPLRAVLKTLYDLQLGSILVEGGSSVFTQFLGAGVVDELSVFLAPIYLKRGVPSFTRESVQRDYKPKMQFNYIDVEEVGTDLLLRAFN